MTRLHSGRLLTGAIVLSALLVGFGVYYTQVYAFYREIPAGSPEAQIRLTTLEGAVEPILTDGFRGIDADSSPIRFRACFHTSQSMATMTETYRTYEGATPLIAPSWFSCFDAGAIDAALTGGTAVAYMGEENTPYGIDRVVAVMDDGRAFAWDQINRCGAEVFDGNDAPEGCPPVPEPASTTVPPATDAASQPASGTAAPGDAPDRQGPSGLAGPGESSDPQARSATAPPPPQTPSAPEN